MENPTQNGNKSYVTLPTHHEARVLKRKEHWISIRRRSHNSKPERRPNELYARNEPHQQENKVVQERTIHAKGNVVITTGTGMEEQRAPSDSDDSDTNEFAQMLSKATNTCKIN
ncbi:hypothetical protein BIW11_03892 [Tropilaelaps mercedesae]|uniref:Uncharacterized protein n=1 Tax=Tropilaelaps mercedesae TaxID=418985 RepID=A0A1V9XE79_9ACAR|nr:hypothetical protein BIW11_03892 [Tropilaelaps mercedesae]